MTSAPDIRDPRRDDHQTFLCLWDACLRLHGANAEPDAAQHIWDFVWSAKASFGLRVASVDQSVVGFALHSWQDNSWTGAVDGCLDTLFVAPEMRRAGLGLALVDDLLTMARARGWKSVFWHVRADNAAARALYDRYGSEDGYLRYRVPPMN